MSAQLFSPKGRGPDEGGGDHYLSISDLMSGIVLVLCLLVVVFSIQYQKTQAELARQQAELEEKERRLREMEEELKNLRLVRQNIVLGLQESFRAENISADISPSTGDISINESLLFSLMIQN